MNQGNQKMPDAEARATAHFDNYVGPVIRLEQKHAYELRAATYYGSTPFEDTVEGRLMAQLQEQAYTSIRHHYITSHVHGTKHGIEDALAAAKNLAGPPFKGGIPNHDHTVLIGTAVFPEGQSGLEVGPCPCATWARVDLTEEQFKAEHHPNCHRSK